MFATAHFGTFCGARSFIRRIQLLEFSCLTIGLCVGRSVGAALVNEPWGDWLERLPVLLMSMFLFHQPA